MYQHTFSNTNVNKNINYNSCSKLNIIVETMSQINSQEANVIRVKIENQFSQKLFVLYYF